MASTMYPAPFQYAHQQYGQSIAIQPGTWITSTTTTSNANALSNMAGILGTATATALGNQIFLSNGTTISTGGTGMATAPNGWQAQFVSTDPAEDVIPSDPMEAAIQKAIKMMKE